MERRDLHMTVGPVDRLASFDCTLGGPYKPQELLFSLAKMSSAQRVPVSRLSAESAAKSLSGIMDKRRRQMLREFTHRMRM